LVESETKQTEKSRLFGSLLRAMQEMSKQSTGLIVHYIEFGRVAVSIVDEPKTKLICTLFHDLEDGSDFGKLLAQQILQSFEETFPDSTFSGTNAAINLTTFNTFSSKIFDAIQGAVQTIVQQLQGVRGINSALVLFDDGTAVTQVQQEDDQLGLVANLQPLITFSTDIMSLKKDRSKELMFSVSRQVVFVHRVGSSDGYTHSVSSHDAALVVICRKSVKPSAYKDNINRAIDMLNKVFALSRSLSFKSGKF